jgi:hypothetical protein
MHGTDRLHGPAGATHNIFSHAGRGGSIIHANDLSVNPWSNSATGRRECALRPLMSTSPGHQPQSAYHGDAKEKRSQVRAVEAPVNLSTLLPHGSRIVLGGTPQAQERDRGEHLRARNRRNQANYRARCKVRCYREYAVVNANAGCVSAGDSSRARSSVTGARARAEGDPGAAG